MQGFSKFIALALSSIFFTTSTYADSAPYNTNVLPFPLMPRLALTGLAGTDTLGAADAMVPLLGNPCGIFYGDVQGKVGNDNAWMGSLGAGYRQVVNNADILGGYLFIDRDETRNKNHFWVLSPGVESMGQYWDVRLNGYIPVSSKKVFDHSSWADDLGEGQFVSFSGHQQFDRQFNFFEEVGAGADGEIGAIIPCWHRLAIYGGGYYFHLQDTSNVKGAEGRIELPVTSYLTALVTDTYDNHEHNTIVGGVRISLGGRICNTPYFDIRNRLLDPIERNLGTVNTGSGIPSSKVKERGPVLLERDNIWFFAQNGANFDPSQGTQNCTYEHPCGASQFVQTNINTINSIAPSTNFYFSPGTYPATGDSVASNAPGRTSFNSGQSGFGRTLDYTLPAQGAERPVFVGGFDLPGNNLLDSMVLHNNAGTQITGINVSGSAVQLNNDEVGTLDSQNGYLNGLNLTNAQGVVVSRSVVNAFSDINLIAATGINIDNSSLILDASEVNTMASITGLLPTAIFTGINATNNSVLTLLHSQVNSTGIAQGILLGTVTGTGVSTTNSLVNSFASDINTNGTAQASASATTLVQGISATNSPVSLKFSSLFTNGSATANTATITEHGIVISGSSLNIDHSIVDTEANAIGTNAGGNAQIQFTNGIQGLGTDIHIDKSKIETGANATANGNNADATVGKTIFSNAYDGILVTGGTLSIQRSIVDTSASATANGLGGSALVGSFSVDHNVNGISANGTTAPVTIDKSIIGMNVNTEGNGNQLGSSATISNVNNIFLSDCDLNMSQSLVDTNYNAHSQFESVINFASGISFASSGAASNWNISSSVVNLQANAIATANTDPNIIANIANVSAITTSSIGIPTLLSVNSSIINAAGFASSGVKANDLVNGFNLVGGNAAINGNIISVFTQAEGFTSADNATSIGINAFNGSTVTANGNEINIFAHSDNGNATAYAFQATGAGTSIAASNNFGIIQASAPNGTATAQSANQVGGGVVTETDDHFFIVPGVPLDVTALQSIKLPSNWAGSATV